MSMSGVQGITQTRPASPVGSPSGGAVEGERVSRLHLAGLNQGTGLGVVASVPPVTQPDVFDHRTSGEVDRVSSHTNGTGAASN
jgi:hypothetical protein